MEATRRIGWGRFRSALIEPFHTTVANTAVPDARVVAEYRILERKLGDDPLLAEARTHLEIWRPALASQL